MACIITYENKQYTQKEFEQYFKEHFTEFVDNFLGSKQDIEGFKEFVQGKPTFYVELARKIQDILQKLYPETKLNITNNPAWEQGDNIFDQKQALENEVAYRLKSVDILMSDKAKQVFAKGQKNNWSLDKILTELAVPKEQKQLLLDLSVENNIRQGIETILEDLNLSELKDSNLGYEIADDILNELKAQASYRTTEYSKKILLKNNSSFEAIVHEHLHNYLRSKNINSERIKTNAESLFKRLQELNKEKDNFVERALNRYGDGKYNNPHEELLILYLTSKEFRDSLSESSKKMIESFIEKLEIFTKEDIDKYHTLELSKKLNDTTKPLNEQLALELANKYGNQWREITINQERDLSNILLQRNEANQIIGQANIQALTVLVDAIKQKQDTLPHEYAHHYIAWFRNTPIVQEAIKKWGSEEALVQSIGEQVVKQKGEAYNWWNNFVKWIMNQFNSLSKLQKEELTQILTDAFLTRQDLRSKQDIEGFINNEEKSLKLALKGLTPEEKISFCNHFGITMTEENGKKC